MFHFAANASADNYYEFLGGVQLLEPGDKFVLGRAIAIKRVAIQGDMVDARIKRSTVWVDFHYGDNLGPVFNKL
jgi:hypothetical protein